jgi:hypothetical protein
VLLDESSLFASAGRKPGRREPETVMTRLRAKQANPGRTVRRRQARRARRAPAAQGNRLMAWLRQQQPRTTTRTNPARDHKSRKSGRLRKELQ